MTLQLIKNKTNVFAHWIHDRVMNKNLNCLICFTGGTGSGKSYCSLKLAEVLAKKNNVEFNVDEHVCFKPKQFIKLINSGKLHRGSIIIIDEAGVAINSRKWQSLINSIINFVIQTFRHRNYVLIMCVPYFDFIDAAVRKMFHSVVEMDKIDFKKGVAWCKPKVIQVNQRTGKTYYKWLRYKFSGEPVCALDSVGFSLPEKETMQKYEEKKTEYTTDLNKNLEKDLDSEENKNPKELTEIQKKILKLRNNFGLNGEDIGVVMRITQQAANSHLLACKSKGFIVNRARRGLERLKPADVELLRERLEKSETLNTS